VCSVEAEEEDEENLLWNSYLLIEKFIFTRDCFSVLVQKPAVILSTPVHIPPIVIVCNAPTRGWD
jgi:hypothetical protein